MRPINKPALLQALVERLTREFERAKAQALDAAAGATHEDNRAEGDKDMRSTEASYIARGYAQRTAALEQAVTRLSHLALIEFDDNDPIKVTALVELAETQPEQRVLYCFLVPVAGGERVEFDGQVIQTLSPNTPLGAALLGLCVGDEAEVESPQGLRIYEVRGVS